MKRFHIHIAVDNLQDNIRFYSALFGTGPVHQQIGLRQVDAG